MTGAVAFAREVADRPLRKRGNAAQKLGTAEENAAIFAAARESVTQEAARTEGAAGRNRRGGSGNADSPSTKAARSEAETFHGMPVLRSIESAHPRLLWRARSGEDSGYSERNAVKPESAVSQSSAPERWAAGSRWFLRTPAFRCCSRMSTKRRSTRALQRFARTTPVRCSADVSRRQFVDERHDDDHAHSQPTMTFADVDMVVEAVFEGMALKKQVFAGSGSRMQARRYFGEQHLDAQHRRNRRQRLRARSPLSAPTSSVRLTSCACSKLCAEKRRAKK